MSRAGENRVEIIGGTRWMERAACEGFDPDVFFPTSGRGLDADAKAICRQCPVRLQCLDYAVTNRFDHGIWGGLNMHERRRVRRQRERNTR